MFRFKSHALFLFTLLLSAFQTSSADLVHTTDMSGGCNPDDPCAKTARCDYYHDNCTQDRYQIFTYCSCKTRIAYYNYSIQPKSPAPALPSNFWALEAMADWTTPGGDTGVYMIDGDGTHIMLRNPYPGEFEREETCIGLE